MPEAEDTDRYVVRVWRKGVSEAWKWRDLTKAEAITMMKQIENREIRIDVNETEDCVLQVTDFSDVWTAKMYKE